MSFLTRLLDEIRTRHPRAVTGVEEARAVDPDRFDALVERTLGWAVRSRGVEAIPSMVEAFVTFSYEVNRAQALYEVEGRYARSTFEECHAECYSRDDYMQDYLWGVFLTNLLWAHHFEISNFYHDRFLRFLPRAPRLVEIAPGHGAWGVWALSCREEARLEGFDISPRAIQISGDLARAAGCGDRATYRQRNALELAAEGIDPADGLISCFLLEHLEAPLLLLTGVRKLLKPGGKAFLTAALTAAQDDHIFEFRRESEVVSLCEQAGLRVLESLSGNPRRTLPGARFLPRSLALVVTPFDFPERGPT